MYFNDFNESLNNLQSLNLNSNLISVGQKLIIPGVAPSNQTNVTYIVQKGDSLWSIANANNTTVDELVNLNDLVTNNIYAGQVLAIPNTGDSGITTPDINNTYVVQKGDTLYSVSLRYNTTPSAIINMNNLTSDILSIGQVLMIPTDIESTGNAQDIIETNSYIVQKGDTLYSISRRYNVSIEDIKSANNLDSNVLSVGQILIIPNTSSIINNEPSSNLYVVQKGDSLWSIANRFNTSVNMIRMINNLNSDILSIGQSLIIP